MARADRDPLPRARRRPGFPPRRKLRCRRKAPTIAFSSAVSATSGLAIWKVRPSRAAPAACGAKRIDQLAAEMRRRRRSARSWPVRRLNSVVLPAPFGPMMLTISPRRTSNETSSTASSPRETLAHPAHAEKGLRSWRARPPDVRASSRVAAPDDAVFHEQRGETITMPRTMRCMPGQAPPRIGAQNSSRAARSETRPATGPADRADTADQRIATRTSRRCPAARTGSAGRWCAHTSRTSRRRCAVSAALSAMPFSLTREHVDAGGARRVFVLAHGEQIIAEPARASARSRAPIEPAMKPNMSMA